MRTEKHMKTSIMTKLVAISFRFPLYLNTHCEPIVMCGPRY